MQKPPLEPMPLPKIVPKVQLVLDQIFIAFGQGAGVMRIEDEAIIYASLTYWSVIEARIDVWENDPFRVREYARTLGHLAAHNALENGRTIIKRKDVVKAIGPQQIRKMQKMLSQPGEADDYAGDEGDCPFCTS